MPETPPAVVLTAVAKSYAGRRQPTPVFEELDLSIARGELLAVVGANGSGKSTLIRLIAGLLLPEAGTVRVRERLGSFVDPARHPGTGSAVFDGSRGLYWRLTVAENIRYQASMNAVAPAPGLRAAEPWLDRFGLASKRDELVQTLSKGTQQKIAIVCALAFAKPLLLLDEPTTLLDEVSCALLAGILHERSSAGQTVIVATHDRDFVARLGTPPLQIAAGGRVHRLPGCVAANAAIA